MRDLTPDIEIAYAMRDGIARRGMSVQKIAAAAKVNRNAISRTANGTQQMGLRTFGAMLKAMDPDLYQLLLDGLGGDE